MITTTDLRWWHLPALHEIEQVLFGRDAWTRESFWNELAQPTRWYRAAEDEGELVGYAGLAAYGDEGFVQTIGVTVGRQGAGVGALLLDELVGRSEELGVRTLMLEVRAGNERAAGLYLSRGFERTGVRRGYYQPSGEDAVTMSRRV